jgi:transcriptional regulator with XRE-family HTH domain
MAGALGWPQSKISKIENGRQMPTEDDITAWAGACCATEQENEELLGLLAEVHALHRDWRQRIRTGQTAIQRDYDALAHDATVIRNAETACIPGLLQTAAYARCLIAQNARHYATSETQAEIDTATAERMRRQQVLYDTTKTFEFVITETVLRLLLCPADVMLAQLDRLLALIGMPNLTLAIIPFGVPLRVAPQHGFILFDDLAIVETFTSEAIHRGPEAATYARIMDDLREEAVTDEPARQLIVKAIQALGLAT